MDGNKHTEIIQSWFNSAVHEGGIERYDHLHIDEIDAAWEPRRKWTAAALESFETALQVRDAYTGDAHLTIVLAFTLASNRTRWELRFKTARNWRMHSPINSAIVVFIS